MRGGDGGRCRRALITLMTGVRATVRPSPSYLSAAAMARMAEATEPILACSFLSMLIIILSVGAGSDATTGVPSIATAVALTSLHASAGMTTSLRRAPSRSRIASSATTRFCRKLSPGGSSGLTQSGRSTNSTRTLNLVSTSIRMQPPKPILAPCSRKVLKLSRGALGSCRPLGAPSSPHAAGSSSCCARSSRRPAARRWRFVLLLKRSRRSVAAVCASEGSSPYRSSTPSSIPASRSSSRRGKRSSAGSI